MSSPTRRQLIAGAPAALLVAHGLGARAAPQAPAPPRPALPAGLLQPICECGHGPSPRALAAAAAALERVTQYPTFRADALLAGLRARFALDVGAAVDALPADGSFPFLVAATETFCGPGRALVRPTPAFPYLDDVAAAAGAAIQRVPLAAGGTADLAALARAAAQDAGLVLLTNPHSPTGTWLPPVAIAAFAAALPADTVCLVDEAYVEYAAGYPRDTAFLHVHGSGRLLVSRTFSKFYGLAGLRVGYGVGPAALLERVAARLPVASVNAVGMAAALAALDDAAHEAAGRVEAGRVRAAFARALAAAGCAVYPSQAGFVFADVGKAERAAAAAARMAGSMLRVEQQPEAPTGLRISLPPEAEFARLCAELLAALA